MSKIELELECFSDEFVVCEPLAVIRGEGVYLVFDRQPEFTELVANGTSRSPRYLSQQGETRFSLDQRQRGLFLLFADQCIHFPVTQAFSGTNDGWTLLNGTAIGQFAPPIIGSVSFRCFFWQRRCWYKSPPVCLSSRTCW